MKKQWKILTAVILLFAVMVTGTAKTAEAFDFQIEDGEYLDSVILEGGSGRASVTSPCVLVVEDGKVYARIEWSSPYYDYMILDGETYLPVNEEGNSVFEIPVTVFDEPITVIADTTAMSVPHEITYILTFDGSLIQHESTAYRRVVPALLIGIAILICVLLIAHRRLHPPAKQRRVAERTVDLRKIWDSMKKRGDGS